jgi:two-component system nitrogen regulation response regulator NtrX
MEAEVRELKKYAEFDEMIGDSPPMKELKRLIARIAPTEGRVFITGENGTGKELAARAVHFNSRRKDKPFIKINCAALPKDLIESELFGYEKGAFTGAAARKIGQIELAHTGTLFLDEIGDMSLDTQSKLLRVLEENEFIRLGGCKPIQFDVRIISATNQDLEKKIVEGTFREDLYHRLRVIPVEIPPLQDRREDIPELARHFIAQCAAKNGKRTFELDSDALNILKQQEWRGNIRELRNVIERIAIMADKPVVSAEDIVPFVPVTGVFAKDISYTDAAGHSLRELTDSFVKSILLQEYKRCGGSVLKVAAKLKIDRANLHRKLKTLGIK